MDFGFTQDQELLKSSVASFVDREVIPAASRIDEEGRFCADIVEVAYGMR